MSRVRRQLARAAGLPKWLTGRGVPSGRTCVRPFTFAGIDLDGRVYCCCPGWVKFPLGRLSKNRGIADLWNNRIARAFRAAMISTELNRVCRTETCPHILCGDLPRISEGRPESGSGPYFGDSFGEAGREALDAIAEGRCRLADLPRHVEISADERCNLQCPSCRDRLVTRVPTNRQRLFPLISATLENLAPGLRRLHLSGSGEAFYAPFTLQLLRGLNRGRYPDLKVSVLTNGQLLTGRMWRSLGPGAEFIDRVSISIDAASQATYEKLRRGGNWQRLLVNLDFVRSLRRSGVLEQTSANFVISVFNYREIPAFIRLAREFEMDSVVFTAIQEWKEMEFNFEEVAVHLPGHPEHGRFRQILADPICRSHGVLLGVSNQEQDRELPG